MNLSLPHLSRLLGRGGILLGCGGGSLGLSLGLLCQLLLLVLAQSVGGGH